MSQMTPQQARVIDPILTAVARGYEPQQNLIKERLFPRIDVVSRGGTIVTFGREQFQIINTQRAPGADTRSIQIGHGKDTYALVDNRLMGKVPVEDLEEAEAVPGIDLASGTIKVVQDMMALEQEQHAATLARAQAAYASTNKTGALSGGDLWTDPTSNPFVVIEAGKEAIRKKIGRRPNFMELGPTVLNALRIHPKVLDRLSTATDRPPATIAQLVALFEIAEIVEGEAIADANGNFYDIWGNDAILAYTTPKSLQAKGSQSFGYTYCLKSRPIVEQPFWDGSKASWMYPVSDASKVVLTSADSGYLIRNAVAP